MTTVFLGINALFSVLVFLVAEKDCKQCPSVLQELENIDDEAEDNGKFLTANFAFAVLFLRDQEKRSFTLQINIVFYKSLLKVSYSRVPNRQRV